MKHTKKPVTDRPRTEDGVSTGRRRYADASGTIIIAAVVSSFASGLGTTSEAAPTVSLQVSLYGGTLEKKQS